MQLMHPVPNSDQKGLQELEWEGTQPKAALVRMHKVNDNY